MTIECSIIFWIVAIAISAYWGAVGLDCLKDEKSIPHTKLHKSSYFVSDFLVSLAGWLSLFVLIETYADAQLSSLNIFLGIVAFMGITGYGFELAKYFSNKFYK